jgi:hypothetical protein
MAEQAKAEVISIDKNQRAGARFTVQAQIDGYPVLVDFEGSSETLRSVIERLKAIGAQPPAQTSAPLQQQPDAPPKCKYHGPMKQGKHGWFCPRKLSDGSYCDAKVEA